MVPASFEESNLVLGKPDSMTVDQCDPLNVFHGAMPDGTPALISCWKMTKEELAEIVSTGRVWLIVWGNVHPPVVLVGNKPNMKPAEDNG